MENKNFYPLSNISFKYFHFLYVDTRECLADNVFFHNNLPVKFKEILVNDDCEYIFVHCKIRKKYIQEFLDCMKLLRNKMLLCGHNDYDEFCENIYQSVMEEE